MLSLYTILPRVARQQYPPCLRLATQMEQEFPATLSKDPEMYRNIQRAMTTAFGLALIAAMGMPAVAQDEDVMPSGEQSVAADYGKGCCDVCCSSGGFYGEFQYVRLSTHSVYGYQDAADDGNGYRIVGGYESCDGLGLRVRYFDFDNRTNTTPGTVPSLEGLDLEYLDIEVTQSFCLCNLNGVVSAGYRHADVLVWDGGTIPNNAGDYKGDGITLGLQLERQVTCNFGLYAWAQHSMLYGRDAYNPSSNTIFQWTEVQLGGEYNTCVAGYNTFVRAGVEAHAIEDVEYGYNPVGAFGWFVSAGMSY